MSRMSERKEMVSFISYLIYKIKQALLNNSVSIYNRWTEYLELIGTYIVQMGFHVDEQQSFLKEGN